MQSNIVPAGSASLSFKPTVNPSDALHHHPSTGFELTTEEAFLQILTQNVPLRKRTGTSLDKIAQDEPATRVNSGNTKDKPRQKAPSREHMDRGSIRTQCRVLTGALHSTAPFLVETGVTNVANNCEGFQSCLRCPTSEKIVLCCDSCHCDAQEYHLNICGKGLEEIFRTCTFAVDWPGLPDYHHQLIILNVLMKILARSRANNEMQHPLECSDIRLLSGDLDAPNTELYEDAKHEPKL